MDKIALKTRMLDLEAAELAEDESFHQDLIDESSVDGDVPDEKGEDSQAIQTADIAAALENPILAHRAKIERLREIDFSPKSLVEEGAAVKIDGDWLVISVATSRFDFDGASCMGISAAAPIFVQMQGLAKGDSFRMGGRERKIEDIV